MCILSPRCTILYALSCFCVVRLDSDFLIKALVLLEIRFKKAYSFLYDEELPAERQVCHTVLIAESYVDAQFCSLHLPLLVDLKQCAVPFLKYKETLSI